MRFVKLVRCVYKLARYHYEDAVVLIRDDWLLQELQVSKKQSPSVSDAVFRLFLLKSLVLD